MIKHLLAFAVALAACAEPPSRAPDERPTPKPTAAVATTLDARPLGDGRYQVTLTAIPRRDAAAIELRLDPRAGATLVSGQPQAQFGATPAGARRELRAEVRAQGAGATVFGHAAITAGGATRSKSIDIALGEPAPPAPTPVIRKITLPDGTRVAETRP